ncbi:MAG: hypothetical protein KDA78_11910 [Planctomycetaceae bacterium]|nr:hypothetical protein [Planctomycetaceae bacterium]
MIGDVLQHFSYSLMATVALLLFLSSFLAVCLRTYLTTSQITDEQASIPLSDGKRLDS